jgi:hypothetical protein
MAAYRCACNAAPTRSAGFGSLRRVLWRVVAVLAPLACGGAIYVGLRTPDLRLFGWLHEAGLTAVVRGLRDVTAAGRGRVPGWILYSAPDGLWLLSLLMAVDALWYERPEVSRVLNVTLVAAALAHETAQACWPTMGTFDWSDVACYFAAAGVVRVGMRRPFINREEYP